MAGPVLDVGCGPGRFVIGLAQRGTVALGVDPAPAAVALCRSRGAPVLQKSVFDPLPGQGRWRTVLLADGNIGIGGDPAAAAAPLRRTAGRRRHRASSRSKPPTGAAGGWRPYRARLERGRSPGAVVLLGGRRRRRHRRTRPGGRAPPAPARAHRRRRPLLRPPRPSRGSLPCRCLSGWRGSRPTPTSRCASTPTRARCATSGSPPGSAPPSALLFTICFVTGLFSHAHQHPVSWFPVPARPAGLFRFTQGLHVAAGIASVPVLVAKLWLVWPRSAVGAAVPPAERRRGADRAARPGRRRDLHGLDGRGQHRPVVSVAVLVHRRPLPGRLDHDRRHRRPRRRQVGRSPGGPCAVRRAAPGWPTPTRRSTARPRRSTPA